ncbi:MAG TPA: hypothetical protein VKQ27_12880 [Acetobacteraceae bacterium]|nr:hypothetical protein [Acetobacteraceae bacterium]
MAQVEFSYYSYFPCLQSSEAEHLAYRELADEDKEAILPVFEINQAKNEASLQESIDSISGAIGDRPFILDLSKDRAPPAYVQKNNPDHVRIAQTQALQDAYNAAMTALLAPENGFVAWRNLIANFPNAIPVLQFTDPATQANSVLRQAVRLSDGGSECIAVRISQDTNPAIFGLIGQIIAILESASRLLIILDCGQGRQMVTERVEFARQAIARILEEIEPSQAPYVSAVCMSDFFTTPPNGDGVRVYENGAWGLWSQASEGFALLFGDYCGHRRLKKNNTFMPGDWKARVTYPLDDAWLIYKHANSQDAQGWITGAQEIRDHEDFVGFPECWGGTVLERASNDDIAGLQSGRFWDAAKINMHIHRQIRFSQEVMNPEE